MKWTRFLIAFLPVTWLSAAPQPSLAPSEMVDTYTAMAEQQGARMRGASMEVDIEASLPKLKKQGRLHALRRISRLGRISYEALRFEGDKTVKNDVIVRYLSAESQAQGSDSSAFAITPANYKFKYRGLAIVDGRQVHVFRLTPRRKRVGLFKGELWLDAATYLPVRDSGRFVRNPSIFVRRIEFIRDYDLKDGLAIPRRIETTVETRVVGKAELSVEFRNVSLAGDGTLSTAAGATQ